MDKTTKDCGCEYVVITKCATMEGHVIRYCEKHNLYRQDSDRMLELNNRMNELNNRRIESITTDIYPSWLNHG